MINILLLLFAIDTIVLFTFVLLLKFFNRLNRDNDQFINPL